MSRGIESLINSAPKVHIATGISDWYLEHLPYNVKLHMLHKPYACDFKKNKEILAENASS